MTLPGPLSDLSAVKLALMARQARAQVGAITRAEPIAIIGMGCRFPGGANSPDEFWGIVRDGVDAVGPIPRSRWDVSRVHADDPSAPGKSSVRDGGFIDGVDLFDAPYFGIIRREAEKMDPQHRVFLEVAIEALDHAGLSQASLAGSSTGVFVASYYNDYADLQLADREAIDARSLTGMLHSVLANRLSYLLDLRGPSLSIDTACSSSLVAVHLACQSLRAGDSRVALAGGVSLMLTPDMMVVLSKVGFMSPSGRCRTFDDSADGFIRGEGCGVVVLKLLSEAIADGDRVLAVIRGSAVNQDGRSTVMAAPNGLAQQALVRDALAAAHLTPERIGFVETHGTATPLGDPIEVEALAATIGAPRADGSRCLLGSVKANIGHLEAAAGVAGLIKTTLMLQHGVIPRQVHYSRLNHHVSLDHTCLRVADATTEWAPGAKPRVAGVSGFGVGGTNAHVLVEEAPHGVSESGSATDPPYLLPISARSPAALCASAERWVTFLQTASAPISEICATACARRSHHDHRLALVGESAADFAAQLQSYLDDASGPVASGYRPSGAPASVAFVFSGQGPQWDGMGRDLMAREPAYREALATIDARFSAIAGWSLIAALDAPDDQSRLHETEVAQPAIFALQVALVALWESWGVRAESVIGHSVGEIAALHVAGVLSLDDALRIVYHRARIMQRATGHGRMVAVALDAASAAAMVVGTGGRVSLGAVNGPRSTVLSGAPDAIDALMTRMTTEGVQHRALPVTYAFHSEQMAPFQHELADAIGSLRVSPARIAVFSTVSGARIDHTQVDAAYFARNVRDTVRFADAMNAMLVALPPDAILEVAPHPVLAGPIAECVTARALATPVLASLRRGQPSRGALLRACAGVYVAGATPDWSAVVALQGAPVHLPAYPWQHERYWLRPFDSEAQITGARDGSIDPLLGRGPRVTSDGTTRFDAEWPAPGLAWISEHRLGNQVVMPAAAMLELLRRSARSVIGSDDVTLTDFIVHAPLVLADDASASWSACLIPDGAAWRAELRSGDADASVAVLPQRCLASASVAASSQVSPPLAEPVVTGHWQHDHGVLYEHFDTLGNRFGPSFRCIDLWRTSGDAAQAWLQLRDVEQADGVQAAMHPTLLDGALQLCVMAITANDDMLPSAMLVPMGVESFTVVAPAPPRMRVTVQVVRDADSDGAAADARLVAEDGTLVAELRGARFARVSAGALASFTEADDDVYDVEWQRTSASSQAGPSDLAGAWIVFTNGGAGGSAIVSSITRAGGSVVNVRSGAETRDDGDGWTIAAGDHRAIGDCLRTLTARTSAVRGVVHAWSIDAPAEAPEPDWYLTESALALVQALARAPIAHAPLWFVTQNAQPAFGAVRNPMQAGLWGLAATAALEHPELACRVVDVDADDADDLARTLVAELARRDSVPRVALRGDERRAPRLTRHRMSSTGALAMPADAILSRTDANTLESVGWVAAPRVAEPGPHDVRLRVLHTGINFRDVLLALGMYPGNDAPFGAECVGVIEAVGERVTDLRLGETVFGLAPASMSTRVVVPAAFVAAVPPAITEAQAASLPVAFLTAMYGLHHLARIGPGTSVLVHAAAGGVGLAAVQLVQRAGGTVFATAGSDAKRDYLRSLGVKHVFDSRSVSFANAVLTATDGRGVDVVLNSLSGEFIAASVRTLATGGWLLELGKRDVWTPAQMSSARPDVRYRVYDLDREARADPSIVRPMLESLRSWLADGSIVPLPVASFDAADVTSAFRFMAQARHIGKLVLHAPHSDTTGADAPLVRDTATYLITGGIGAVGVRTAQWLVAHGARTIVLTARGAPSADSQRIIDACRGAGAAIHLRTADSGDRAAMQALLADLAATLPPLRGIVHAAGVVDDGVLLQATRERWHAVQRGKAHGARILDALTEALPLDFFVMYSAAGLYLGPVGQGAYATANAELDAIASARRGRGLPGLSVSWGRWPDAGMAASVAGHGHDTWADRGLQWLVPSRAFAQLGRLMRSNTSHAVVAAVQWSKFLARLPDGLEREFFSAVAPTRAAAPSVRARTTALPEAIVDRWRQAPSAQWPALVQAHLLERTRQVLGVSESVVIVPGKALKDAGLDSLMAVELRNVLTRSLGTTLPATLLFDYPTLDALTSFVQKAVGLTEDHATAGTTTAVTETEVSDAQRDIAALSDEEADALLLAELDSLSGQGRR